MTRRAAKTRNHFYCVVMRSGHFCLWSMATNRSASWRAFTRGIGDGTWSKEKQAKKEGLRCVRVRLVTDEPSGT